MPKLPAAQIWELIPNSQHPLLFKEPCNAEVPKPLAARGSAWLLPGPLRCVCPCPYCLLHLLV